MAVTVWTIGHSTRALDLFLGLLERERIERLVDVRAFPVSKRYPHFNRESLSASLASRDISYRHAPELGGRRTAPKDSEPSAWRNSGFRGYAYYMTTPAFADAIAELKRDALVASGDTVLHIGDSGVSVHQLTKFAVVAPSGTVLYPADATPKQLSLLGE
jgi:uncharacterized protein (DUF488 family)